MAMAGNDPSRILFGRLPDGTKKGNDGARDHNQSRKNCDDIPKELRDAINATTGLAFTERKTHAFRSPHPTLEREWLHSKKSGRFMRPSGTASLRARPAAGVMTMQQPANVEVAWEGMRVTEATAMATNGIGTTELATFEQTSFGGGRVTFIPPHAGAWRLAVDIRGIDSAGLPVQRTVDVGVSVVKPVAKLGAVSLVRDRKGNLVAHVKVVAREAGRYGAALIFDQDGELRSAQESVDLEVGSAIIDVLIAGPGTKEERIAIEEVALIAHDRAETVDQIKSAQSSWLR
jgi:hypothetical protein